MEWGVLWLGRRGTVAVLAMRLCNRGEPLRGAIVGFPFADSARRGRGSGSWDSCDFRNACMKLSIATGREAELTPSEP